MRRLLAVIPVVVLVSVVTFVLLHVVSGSFVPGLTINPHMSQADLDRIRGNLGLNKPLYEQYWIWLSHIVTLDFGNSLINGTPVTQLISEHIGATLVLVGTAIAFGLIVAVPLGIVQALRSGSGVDKASSAATAVGFATPQFWLGLIGILLFSVYFKEWGLPSLPATGDQTPFDGSLPDRVRHLIMPAAVLSIAYVATWSRFIRSSALEVMSSDYIRTARAKGMSERRVVYVHALRNAILPIITLVALELATLFSGAAVVEIVFGWPGIGQLAYNSVLAYDYTTVMGITVVTAVLVVLCNLAADLTYAFVNPKIRFQ
jgi:peptide/nickel transport system permease protein